MVDLRSKGGTPYFAQAHGSITARRILVGPFTAGGSALPQRWYEVELCSYFNGPWQQPAHVVDLAGPEGGKLSGKLVEALDPEIDETEHAVRGLFECPSPPCRTDSALSNAEIAAAVHLVQKKVLRVRGHDEELSSETVGDVVRRFMTVPGLREREGWQAKEAAPGLVDVTYSFWDGHEHGIARWQAIPRADEVRYRNRSAKQMSWSPAD